MPLAVAVRLGMHQEGGAAVQLGADEIQAALGLLPVLHHHVFQLFVQEFFGRLFELRVHFHVVRQHAQRLQVAGLAFFERGEQPLHRFGGVGAVRQHLFERFLARADLRNFGLQPVDLAAQLGGRAAPLRQLLFGAAALAGHRLQFELPLRHGFGKLLAGRFQPLDFRRRPPALRAWSGRSRARFRPGILRSAPTGSSAWKLRPAAAESPAGRPRWPSRARALWPARPRAAG